jgi:Ca-activated chloride channel family protein
MAAQFGFRPANPALTPASPITAAGGVDPTKPSRLLGLPSPRVLAAIKRSWFADRKPANILLVLDTSGSMNDQGRLAAAKAGIGEFIHQAAPQDRIGMLTFSDQIIQLAPIATLARGRAQLQARVRGIIASGGTALFDATARAVRQVKALADTSRINAVVLLTDGEDTDSTTTSDQLLSELRAQGDSSRRVRVFTIAFSADAAGSRQVLAQISQVTGGQAYIGTPQNVQQLYRSISSFF